MIALYENGDFFISDYGYYVRAFDGIPQSRISLEVLTDNFFLYGRVYRSSVCYDPLNV